MRTNPDHDEVRQMMNRRDMMKVGAAMAAAPLIGGAAKGAEADAGKAIDTSKPTPARAYGAAKASEPLGPLNIERRAVGPRDVLLDVLYCGICHSDIHAVRSDWGKTKYPVVPGHEIVGRVQAVGREVTKFKVGDIGGVGCMVDSCGTCENCQGDREQNCLNGTTFTYDSEDRAHGGYTFGGYSDKVVVSERFVIRIPPGVDLAATAPLLCAGVTTFSPMRHWKLSGGQRVGVVGLGGLGPVGLELSGGQRGGVVGLGGLGHMALKLAVARGAEATVFTTSPGKLADAKKMGATEAVLSSDEAAMKRLANTFDLLITTVPKAYPMQP